IARAVMVMLGLLDFCRADEQTVMEMLRAVSYKASPGYNGDVGLGAEKHRTEVKADVRHGGKGSGVTRNLPFMNEKKAALIMKRFGESTDGNFTGSYVLNKLRWKLDDELPFPRKKLRNVLAHYSLGKVTKKILDGIPSRDPVRQMVRRRKAKSCAVVGNAGSVRMYSLGPQIDAHEFVVRLNGGPTAHFAKHVGARTTFRLVNRLHLGFRDTAEEIVLQHVTTPQALDQFITSTVHSKSSSLSYAIDPDFHEYAMTYIDKGVLSNGFYAVLFASEMCENVTIYGFFREWKGATHYHYYNEVEPDDVQSLRDDKEALRLEYFLGNHSASHHYGEPCLDGCLAPCPNCPTGSRCECETWHPVPDAGYCYAEQHPEKTGWPDVSCFRKCPGGASDCPGGMKGYCSEAVMAEEPPCSK
ncbi:hypothetical protein CYMTET_26109, partial [Cymbomonas tetramitiformis]